jgi:hypothetical protein
MRSLGDLMWFLNKYFLLDDKEAVEYARNKRIKINGRIVHVNDLYEMPKGNRPIKVEVEYEDGTYLDYYY